MSAFNLFLAVLILLVISNPEKKNEAYALNDVQIVEK